jgi:hypothetical protein
VLGTAAILHARVPQIGAARFLELPLMQWTGRVSYVWYLWHWPLFAIGAAMGLESTFSGHLIEIVVCVAGSLGLAAATHVLVEDPIRFSRYLAPRRALTLAGAGLVTVITAGTAILWQHAAAQAAHSVQNGRMMEALEDPKHSIAKCPGVDFLGTDLGECDGGNPASRLTVVLFGDSHARQWFPAFDEIGDDRGWRLVLLTKPACPTARLTIFNIALNRPYAECDIWRDAAIKRILSLRPALVVIANRQLEPLSTGRRIPDGTWREASRATLETLNSAGLTTVLLRDNPAPGFDIPDCLNGDRSWWARMRSTVRKPCMVDRAQALDDGTFRAEQEAAAGLQNLHELDLTDLFCDGGVCPPVKNGIIVYKDNSHISGLFSRSLAPALGNRLAPLISNSGP